MAELPLKLPARVNPVALRNGSVHGLTAAVAGPALIWAGYKYPGSTKAKLALMAVGAALIAAHYPYFRSELSRLFQG